MYLPQYLIHNLTFVNFVSVYFIAVHFIATQSTPVFTHSLFLYQLRVT